MSNVRRVLQAFVAAESPSLGSSHVERRREHAQAALVSGLHAVSRTYRFYFVACGIALAGIVVAVAAVMLRETAGGDSWRSLLAALLVAVGALVARMALLWKQKVVADMLAVLSRNLSDEQLTAVITVMIPKL